MQPRFGVWLRPQHTGKCGDISQHSVLEISCEKTASKNNNNIFLFRYGDLITSLKKDVTEACDYLVDNYVNEFEAGSRSDHRGRPMLYHHSSEILFSDGESSFGESSLNQVLCTMLVFRCGRSELCKMFAFVSCTVATGIRNPILVQICVSCFSEHLHVHESRTDGESWRIYPKEKFRQGNTFTSRLSNAVLDQRQANHAGVFFQARLEALSVLIQTPAFDAENCKSWPEIRKGLLDALVDSDEKIWVGDFEPRNPTFLCGCIVGITFLHLPFQTQGLRFIARNLSANNPGTREMYATLGEV